ncbi:MAG: peptidoglycan DD-metalloendopeptidase family protein, partial [Roseburia sp.]|nr:peptidoglycan DD-metalloendopeptidase family protein [Roseburia sp.]
MGMLLTGRIPGGIGMTVQVSATSSKSEEMDISSTSLKDAEDAKDALEGELKKAQQAIRNLKESQGNIKEKVAQLNQQLISISSKITELENQLTAKNEDIVATQALLERAKEQEAQQYEDMKVRIQFMYENGLTSYMEVLFSSGSISEFLNAAEYIAKIEAYDREKLVEYQEIVTAVNDLENQFQQEYEELQSLKATVESEKASVAALMQQKEAELAGLSADISEAQDEAEFYEAEIQAQEELIAAIRRAEAKKKAAGNANTTYGGGPFTWPCPSSSRVTCDYGPRKSPTAGASTDHKGIDIGAAYGADIVAAADGTVITATYSSSAGNYVMIDHGGG